MYKKGFSPPYDFWEQPTQASSDGFIISNNSNLHDIFQYIFVVLFLIMCFLAQYWSYNWKGFV